ncbi:hypothetical protein PENSTE_c017G09021 [Penicillium steckii]|uniref:Major facilitator superfamily (MFS) profile domain-containing protein n=1 Tax=Penicillium steckii TaxID=303698 RepID=A0A1V6SXE3_9EURO|nr:hypothetical protein PENSTE_c017G09021 [Penicillium steckii]
MSGFRYAFSLSAQEVKEAIPPGTVVLLSRGSHTAGNGESTQENELILVPQPSSNPADPLNWPNWRKIAVLACMSLYAAVGNFTSASIASAFPLYGTPLAFNPPVSIGKLSRLIAVNVFMMGAANIWWVPLANIFGRRPIVLGNLLLLVFCSMWAGLTESFGSLLAARTLMGVAAAPSDTIAPNVVGEIFFAHQRGRAMFVLASDPSSGVFRAGNLGLAWIHWINVLVSGILFIACAMLMPETLFIRTSTSSNPDEDSNKMEAKPDVQIVENTVSSSPSDNFGQHSISVSLWNLHIYQGSILEKIAAPWKTLFTITTVGPTLVAAPPYLWGNNSGLIMTGGIVGAILGLIVTNISADRVMLIDAYGPLAADCFVAVTCMRAIISFSWTFFAGEWVSKDGPAIPFGVFGALMGIFSLLTVPVWLWGKRIRIATAKWVPSFS